MRRLCLLSVLGVILALAGCSAPEATGKSGTAPQPAAAQPAAAQVNRPVQSCNCPFKVEGATVSVANVDQGAAITVSGPNAAAVREIQARADAVAKGGCPMVKEGSALGVPGAQLKVQVVPQGVTLVLTAPTDAVAAEIRARAAAMQQRHQAGGCPCSGGVGCPCAGRVAAGPGDCPHRAAAAGQPGTAGPGCPHAAKSGGCPCRQHGAPAAAAPAAPASATK